jgi:arginase
MRQKNISLIGCASGIAAGDAGTGDGPTILATSNLQSELSNNGVNAEWQNILHPLTLPTVLATVADLCTRLAEQTRKAVQQQQLFTVFGGDHSCAIGTWSGVAAALADRGSLGLIWIDAHMDAHTPETSESGNIHGMPVACLLGHGAPELTKILTAQSKIKPEHICLIGIRSYEHGEAELIKRLGVRVFMMEEVAQRGIQAVMQEALGIVRQAGAGYGISIDLDGLDPTDAPAVGTPAAGGICAADLCKSLELLQHDEKLLGAEITEFNPHHDKDKKTEKLICDLLLAIFK